MAGSNVPIDVPLTSISVAAFQSGNGFIADQIFPVVPVDLQTGLYYVYEQDDLNRDTAQERADSTESAGDSFDLSDDSYRCKVWALHKDVGDQLQANYKNVPGTPFNSAAKFVAGKLRLRQELEFAKKFLHTGVWGTDLTGIASGTPNASQFIQFDNDAFNPVETVEGWKNQIWDETGILPNVWAISRDVFTVLRLHPDIKDQFKYTTAENITAQMLAQVFEIDKIVVSRGIYNTAKKGKGVSNSRIFDNSSLLTYAAPEPGVEVPTGGYIFQWTGISDGLGESIGTTQFRIEERRTDRVESQIAVDMKVVAPALGVFATGVLGTP